MSTLIDYKGLQVVDPDPTGDGGLAIQNDFINLVDWHPKSVWAATADPTASDDADDDFYPGSLWLRTNTTPPKLFVCKDSTAGAAVWSPLLLKVVQDTSPQLGGNLDVNGKTITSASSGQILISPNGTGRVFIGSTTNTADRGLPFNIENDVPGIVFYELDAGTDEKGWDFWANENSLFFRAISDDLVSFSTWLEVNRSGSTVTAVKFAAPTQVDAPFRHKQSLSPVVAATDGATVTFDLAESDLHHVTLGGNRTLALSNSAFGQSFKVTLQQDATGGRTVTWWSNILWPGGTVPTLTTTPNKRDVFEFICYAAGNFYGKVWGQNL